MLLRISLAISLCYFCTSVAQAQGVWLQDIFSQSTYPKQIKRQHAERKAAPPHTRYQEPTQRSAGAGSRRWQTSEPLPSPLPIVPAVVASNTELVIYVWLRERVAGVYQNGSLIQSMPIVPGSTSNPSTWLIGKTIVVGDKTKDYWSYKRYPDRHGRMSRAWMAYASRLWVQQADGNWHKSGFFFHKGDMSVWHSKTAGSHGCLRLTWQHAIWVYKNIPEGTPVIVKQSMTEVNS